MKKLVWIEISKLKEIIKSSELTIKDLAEKMQITERSIYRWLQNDIEHIQIANAKALCLILNCSIEDLKPEIINRYSKHSSVKDLNNIFSKGATSLLSMRFGHSSFDTLFRTLFSSTNNPEVQINILMNLAGLKIESIRIKEAYEYVEKAQNIAELCNISFVVPQIDTMKSLIYALQGNIYECTLLIDDVISNIQEKSVKYIDEYLQLKKAMLVKALASFLQGDYINTLSLCQKSMINENFAAPIKALAIHHNIQAYLASGIANIFANRTDAALKCFDSGKTLAVDNHLPFISKVFQIHITAASLDSGVCLSENQIDSFLKIIENEQYLFFSYIAAAKVLIKLSMTEKAIRILTDGLKVLEDSPVLQSFNHLCLSKVYEKLNDSPKASEQLNWAKQLTEKCGIKLINLVL